MEHQLAQVLVIVHYLARRKDFLFEIFAQQPVDGRAAFFLQKVVIGLAQRRFVDRSYPNVIVLVLASALFFEKYLFNMATVAAFPVTNNAHGRDLGFHKLFSFCNRLLFDIKCRMDYPAIPTLDHNFKCRIRHDALWLPNFLFGRHKSAV